MVEAARDAYMNERWMPHFVKSSFTLTNCGR